jgi:4-amino-4-deoxy-L-arabinose transferase-like glycosyltransferase
MVKKTFSIISVCIAFLILAGAGTMVSFYGNNQGYWWDEAVYLGLATNLYEGNGYYINFEQESFRPPVFAGIISSVWTITGVSEAAVYILPILFAIASIVLMYYFVRKLYGREIAIWSSLLLATSHFFMFYSEKLLTETMFIFFIIAGLYTYYLGMETKRRWLLPIAGAIMALSLLTRYIGLLLMVVYILYPIIRYRFWKPGKSPLRTIFIKGSWYWLGIIVFFIVLIPWFMFNQQVFGSPVGAMFVGIGTVTSNWFLGEWYYYFAHWFEIFGLIGIFLFPGLASMFTRLKKEDRMILLLFVASLIFFAILPRKELRYLMHYLPIYLTVFAVGVVRFRHWIGTRRLVYGAAVFFCFINLFAGIQMIQMDTQAGSSLKQAGLYLSDRVPEDMTVMSNNIPQLYYTVGRDIVYFPGLEEDLLPFIEEYNSSYVVIEAGEPSYPEWVWNIEDWVKSPSEVFNQPEFTLERSFEERNQTFVWVYKVNI